MTEEEFEQQMEKNIAFWKKTDDEEVIKFLPDDDYESPFTTLMKKIADSNDEEAAGLALKAISRLTGITDALDLPDDDA